MKKLKFILILIIFATLNAVLFSIYQTYIHNNILFLVFSFLTFIFEISLISLYLKRHEIKLKEYKI